MGNHTAITSKRANMLKIRNKLGLIHMKLHLKLRQLYEVVAH